MTGHDDSTINIVIVIIITAINTKPLQQQNNQVLAIYIMKGNTTFKAEQYKRFFTFTLLN